jgi:hypothetical protein
VSQSAASGTASTAPASVGSSTADDGTLESISKDLDSADSANTQNDADQQTAEDAAATSDG